MKRETVSRSEKKALIWASPLSLLWAIPVMESFKCQRFQTAIVTLPTVTFKGLHILFPNQKESKTVTRKT